MRYINLLTVLLLLLCYYSLSVKGYGCNLDCPGLKRNQPNITCFLRGSGCAFTTYTLRRQNITGFGHISVLIDVHNVDDLRIWNYIGTRLRLSAAAYNYEITSLALNAIIYYVHPELFLRLPNLRYLDGSTEFEYFPYFSRSNPLLTYIHLHFRTNSLTKTLDNGRVSGLRYLKRLSLSHSNILNLADQTFSGLTALTFLRLVRFRIPNPAATFSPLVRLRVLRFHRSKLTDISFLSETPLSHRLTELSLSNNRITSISVISDYDNLVTLSLESNRITRIENKWLNRRTALETLNIDHNPISHLSSRMFEYLPNIKHISLKGVPLHCDCSLQWMSIVSLNFISSRCATPPQHSGKPATDPSIYVTCTQELSYQCFNRSNSCPTGSCCQDTLDSYTCVCEEENHFFVKPLNKCVSSDGLTTTPQYTSTSPQQACPTPPTCPPITPCPSIP